MGAMVGSYHGAVNRRAPHSTRCCGQSGGRGSGGGSHGSTLTMRSNGVNPLGAIPGQSPDPSAIRTQGELLPDGRSGAPGASRGEQGAARRPARRSLGRTGAGSLMLEEQSGSCASSSLRQSTMAPHQSVCGVLHGPPAMPWSAGMSQNKGISGRFFIFPGGSGSDRPKCDGMSRFVKNIGYLRSLD